MTDGFQYGDIIFLALIALLVALRLRSMLGKNTGLDPRELWKQATRDATPEKPSLLIDRGPRKSVAEEEVVPPQLKDNQNVADGLKSIRAVDSSFSTTDFIGGAKLACEWVVDAFAKGNKDKLKTLLSDERYQHFCAEIDTRTKSGFTQETTLVSIEAADITEAGMQSGKEQITVQFTTEQINVTRDKDKNVVAGDISAIEKVIDVWTFERDPSSRDPNWKITAT